MSEPVKPNHTTMGKTKKTKKRSLEAGFAVHVSESDLSSIVTVAAEPLRRGRGISASTWIHAQIVKILMERYSEVTLKKAIYAVAPGGTEKDSERIAKAYRKLNAGRGHHYTIAEPVIEVAARRLLSPPGKKL